MSDGVHNHGLNEVNGHFRGTLLKISAPQILVASPNGLVLPVVSSPISEVKVSPAITSTLKVL